MVGVARTARLAVLLTGPALGISVVVTPEVLLGFVPMVLLVTTTVTVQLPLAGMVRPAKVSAVCPLVKLLLLAPTQVPPAFCAPLIDMLPSVSLKLAPVSGKPFVLANVKVIVLVPPDVIEVGENALAMVGSATTVRLTALLPAPAVGVSVVLTPLVLFGLVPSVLLVTTTVTVQLPLAGIVIPLKVRFVCPLVKLLLLAPVQVPPAFCAPLIAIPVRASVNVAFVCGIPSELDNVKVMVVVPPDTICVGENALAMVGGEADVTVRSAVLLTGPALGISVVVTPLVLFGLVPSVLLVTTTVTVQLPLAGMVTPLKVSAVCPLVKLLLLAPVQVPPAFCAPLIAIFASVSVNVAPVSAVLLLLDSVKVIVLVPPGLIWLGANALAMVGRATTVRLTVLLPVPIVV